MYSVVWFGGTGPARFYILLLGDIAAGGSTSVPESTHPLLELRVKENREYNAQSSISCVGKEARLADYNRAVLPYHHPLTNQVLSSEEQQHAHAHSKHVTQTQPLETGCFSKSTAAVGGPSSSISHPSARIRRSSW
jgi:hypothetical protein